MANRYMPFGYEIADGEIRIIEREAEVNHSQVSRHKKAQFFWGSGYFVCSQYGNVNKCAVEIYPKFLKLL